MHLGVGIGSDLSESIRIDLQIQSDKNFTIRSDLIRIGSDPDQSDWIALCN